MLPIVILSEVFAAKLARCGGNLSSLRDTARAAPADKTL